MFSSFFKKKAPPTRTDLMAALKFTDADLKANRDGYMTTVQRQALRRKQMWQAAGMWGMAGFMAITVAVLGASSASPRDITSRFDVMLIPLAMFIGLLLVFVWMAFRYQSQTKADLHKGQVASLSGMLHRKTYVVYTGKTMVRVYELHLMDEVFKVSYKVYDAFIDGDTYEIFYAPNTRALLSADPANG